MRPCLRVPLMVRCVAFGGPDPVFCVPLMADRLGVLQEQAAAALGADVLEWRADGYADLRLDSVLVAARFLRSVAGDRPLLFTLRAEEEGGLRAVFQDDRAEIVDAVLRSGLVDVVDLELCNGPEFLAPLLRTARAHGVRTLLSFHDFVATPASEVLLDTVGRMVAQGCDIAKFACMPQSREDVLRLLGVTSQARDRWPEVGLCTMAMGELGVLTRVAGFLFGSDMAFAAGPVVSAPGQIPLDRARMLAAGLLGAR